MMTYLTRITPNRLGGLGGQLRQAARVVCGVVESANTTAEVVWCACEDRAHNTTFLKTNCT